MFYCPLCENEYIITTSLCERCGKIRDLIKVYGVDRILERLQTTYIVQKPKIKNEETTDEKNENTKSKK